MRSRYVQEPSPHIVIDQLVPPERYSALRFPDELIRTDAPWGLTSSDPDYAELLGDSHWRMLHDELRGESFVHQVLGMFASDMRKRGCPVVPDQVHVAPFTETREEKETAVLACDGDPSELYTRLDFQMKSAGGYREFVHLDWARRIVGGILFFSDAEEEGMEGGELGLYRDRAFRNDRWCHDPELVLEYPARHNTGVIFLNSNEAFHGPRAITRLAGRRRWLYYTISSRLDVWPCEPRQP